MLLQERSILYCQMILVVNAEDVHDFLRAKRRVSILVQPLIFFPVREKVKWLGRLDVSSRQVWKSEMAEVFAPLTGVNFLLPRHTSLFLFALWLYKKQTKYCKG